MGKLSNLILNEKIDVDIIIGMDGKARKVIKPKTPEQLEKLKQAQEKRQATLVAREKEKEELIQLRTEKAIMDEDALKRAQELRERLNKEAELEKLRAEDARIKAKKESEEKAAEIARIKAEKEAERVEAEAKKAAEDAKIKQEHEVAVNQNNARQQSYETNIQATKEHEKPKPIEKPKSTTSGLISTEVRSLRF